MEFSFDSMGWHNQLLTRKIVKESKNHYLSIYRLYCYGILSKKKKNWALTYWDVLLLKFFWWNYYWLNVFGLSRVLYIIDNTNCQMCSLANIKSTILFINVEKIHSKHHHFTIIGIVYQVDITLIFQENAETCSIRYYTHVIIMILFLPRKLRKQFQFTIILAFFCFHETKARLLVWFVAFIFPKAWRCLIKGLFDPIKLKWNEYRF